MSDTREEEEEEEDVSAFQASTATVQEERAGLWLESFKKTPCAEEKGRSRSVRTETLVCVWRVSVGQNC